MKNLELILLLGALVVTAGCRQKDEPLGTVEEEPMTVIKGAIEPGSDQKIEIAGGEQHVWTWKVPAGQFAGLEVEKQGIDLTLRLFPPGAEEPELEVNGLNGEWGTERLAAVAEGKDVAYRVEIVPNSDAADAGGYRVVASVPRAATDVDRRNVDAERAFDAAERLRRQRDADSLRQSLDAYRQALATFEETDDVEHRLVILDHLGRVYEDLESRSEARQTYHRLLAVSREIGRRLAEGKALNRLGRLDFNEGNELEAEKRIGEALAIADELGDASLRATCLNNLASIAYRREDLATAVEQFEEVRQVWEDLGRPREQADALNNKSLVLRAQGRFEDAVDALARARDLRQQAGDEASVAAVLVQMGSLKRWLGDLEEARNLYEQALAIGADKLSESIRVTLANNLGLVLAESGEETLATERFEEALADSERLGRPRFEAMAALNLGALRRSAGQLTEALDLVRRARDLFEELGDRRNLAACGLVEAQALRRQGRTEPALAILTAAVEQVEALRLDHAGWGFRMAFFATRQSYYDELIDLLVELHAEDGDRGYLERALHAGERRRARSLLDALAEGKLHYRGEDPSLLDRERQLTVELAEVDAELRLPAVGEQDELERQRRKLLLELETVRTKIRRASPQYSELTRPQPLDVEAIRTEVLDAGTRLLVYSLGEDKSLLWTLGRDEPLEVFELPGRREIEAAVAAAREAFASRSQQRQTSHRLQLERFSDLLLGPVAASLDERRLAVVADGALQTVPFSALPEPAASAPAGGPRPWLIEGREVVHLPSASFLAALRSEVGERRRAPYAVAVFADPVFSDNDPRLEGRPTQKKVLEELDRALHDVGSSPELPRLEATTDEAEAIARLVDVRYRSIAISFDASRETFEALDLSRYRILHFATHGLLDTVHPELSGLVLSLIDEEGQPVDGFIRAHELYTRPLGAELVVLSACETGLGREVRGEGVVGLPRGFLYAGVPRVVVSLWNVADRSTAELMTTFYEGLGRGLAPSSALRGAQLAMLQSENENRRLPFYWGAFAFVGEWRRESGPGGSIDQDDQGGIVLEEPDKGTAYEESGDTFAARSGTDGAPADPEIWGRAWAAAPTDDLQHPDDFINGVDAETGSFLPPDPTVSVESMRLGPRNARRLRHWVQYYHPEDATRLPLHGVDPEDLAQAGWAVVFCPGVSSEARAALEPLLSIRESQAGELFRRIEFKPGTDALTFLEDEAGAFGPADPQKLPYYVLLVGDPAELPFEFQYLLDVQYAVGRLHFADDGDYGLYAQAVKDAEAASAEGREAVFWGTDIPDDPYSRWMMEGLVEPLIGDLRTWRRKHGLYDVTSAADGRRATLFHLLGDAPPAFLFTASHGMVFSSDPDVQRERQGAFLCEDRGPRQQGTPVKREHYFAAEDLPRGADLQGLIAFHFACYSAGCSERDDFESGILGGGKRLAPKPFVSRLSQRLLSSGAQAVVGHVNRAWTTSFSWKNHGDQTRVFGSMLRQLLRGHRLGHATEWVHYRYAECSTHFNRLLEAKLEEVRLGIEDSDSLLYKQLRKATLDARNYLVIGDPAVRLVGAGKRRLQRSKTA